MVRRFTVLLGVPSKNENSELFDLTYTMVYNAGVPKSCNMNSSKMILDYLILNFGKFITD